MKTSVRQKLFLLSFIILAVNGLLGYSVYQSNQNLIASQQWIQHTERVIEKSEYIFSLAREMESSARGFIITGDSTFLEPLYVAQKSAFVSIQQFGWLTKDNPSQQRRLDSLDFYMRRRLDFSLKMIEIRNEKGLSSAVAFTLTKKGVDATNHLRQIINDIQHDEHVLLRRRTQTNLHDEIVFKQFLIGVFVLMAGFTIMLLIIAGKYLIQNNEREKRAAELVIANRELLFQSLEKAKRARELGVANEELLFQNAEKEKRAAELGIANEELLFQNGEKEKRAQELIIANHELLFQNHEKEKRATELTEANIEKKLTEQQREFDRNNLDALINNTNDLMWSVDTAFNLITSNQPFNDTMKRTSGQSIAKGGNVLSTTYSSEQAEPYKKLYERAFTGESFTETLFNEFPVNTWSEISYCPIRKGNEVIGTACHSRNITEKIKADLERTKIVNDLMLQNTGLEQFAYIISHNLRGPVANIIGASEALNDTDLSIADREMLSKGINVSIKRLDDVVQDLNQILQVKGEINERKEIVVFSELVDGIKISIKDVIDKYHIKINYDFLPVNEYLTLKPYLYSIFYNLISNSVKYRRQDVPGVVEIKSSLVNNKLELIFKDNGMGIDLERKGGEVFGLYKRFHSGIEGKGMGLYMVKTQVETLGGKIEIQSAVNQGTEFKIEFEV